MITDRAIAWLRSLPKGQPFLLRVSHNWPHTPVLAPPPFDSLYHPNDIPVRFYDGQAYQTRARRDRRLADIWRMRELPRAQVRQMWKDYVGLVGCVDHETGRLLPALRELGLEENTIWGTPEAQPVIKDLRLKLEGWYADVDRPTQLFSVSDKGPAFKPPGASSSPHWL